jgi:hypothetical protein
MFGNMNDNIGRKDYWRSKKFLHLQTLALNFPSLEGKQQKVEISNSKIKRFEIVTQGGLHL